MSSPWRLLLLVGSLGSLGSSRLAQPSSSSSGYAYEQRDGLPVSYVHYSSQIEDAYPVHGPYLGRAPLAPYYSHYVNHGPGPADASSEEEEEASGGSAHRLEGSSESGERGRQGYARQRGFEAAEAERRDAAGERAQHEEEAGHASGHESSAGEHEAHQAEEAARESGSHGAGSFHRKGERTSGYHKVYRKDEFKKNSEFYDEGHDGGQYERYGSRDASHGAEEARRAEAASHAEGHQSVAKASRGHADAGREQLERRAHEAEAAEDAHSRERQEHASRASSQARRGSRYRR